MRLDKFLAEASVGTRKIIRTYVKEGKVTVNEQLVSTSALEIDENADVVKCLGRTVIHTGKVYYMFHKPAGCVTARKDPVHPTVLDYFNKVNTDGLFPVGRLDKDTEGLLFLTNDGSFNQQLMDPGKHVDKKYFFWAFGVLEAEYKKRLETGICIRPGESLTKSAKIDILKQGPYEELKNEMVTGDFIKKKKNLYQQSVISGYLTISEGRKHQVKRMLKAVGCYVVYLQRIAIGEIMLDTSLEKGQYRVVTQEELQKLSPKYPAI
jgi:16S rRNA pseudouridine516 synthase